MPFVAEITGVVGDGLRAQPRQSHRIPKIHKGHSLPGVCCFSAGDITRILHHYQFAFTKEPTREGRCQAETAVAATRWQGVIATYSF